MNNGLDSSFVQHVCLCCDWLIFQSFNKRQFIILSDKGSDTTFRTYRLDHSFVTFFGCGSFFWIPVPTLCHQLFPEWRRRLTTLSVNWTVTSMNPVKQILQCCHWSISKGPLPIPHLPHYQPKAVDVCLGVVRSGIKHFRCHTNRCSRIGAVEIYFCSSQTKVSNFHCVFFSQLKWNKK